MRRQPAWHRSHRALPARYWNVAFRDLASHVPLLAGAIGPGTEVDEHPAAKGEGPRADDRDPEGG